MPILATAPSAARMFPLGDRRLLFGGEVACRHQVSKERVGRVDAGRAVVGRVHGASLALGVAGAATGHPDPRGSLDKPRLSTATALA